MPCRDIRDLCLERGAPGEFAAIERAVKRTGGCSQPIRLVGRSTDGGYSSKGEPDGVLLVACGRRHSSRCPSCAAVYRGDARQIVLAGLAGGKGVPESVATHPTVLVTLTAPSFGAVHSARNRHCHLGPPGLCPHGRPMHCLERHDQSEEIVGAPLCKLCFDPEATVLFNANVSELWRRTVIYTFRHLAYSLGTTEKGLRETARLAFCKVVEFQRRGTAHIHAVIRVDGADGAGDELAPPPAEITAQHLVEAVHRAARAVRVTRELDGRELTFSFGRQLRVDVLDHDHAGKIAGYVSKYVTKATDSGGVLNHRLREGEVELLDVPDHVRLLLATAWRLGTRREHSRLRRWAHAYCFAGHVMTKSRRFSTTMGSLRRARREWRCQQLGVVERTGVTEWQFEGVGHRREIDRVLASWHAESQRTARLDSWFTRTTAGFAEAG